MARFEQYVDFRGHKYHDGASKQAGGLEEIQAAFGLLHLHHNQLNVPCEICGRLHLDGFEIEYNQSSDDEHQLMVGEARLRHRDRLLSFVQQTPAYMLV